MDGILKKQLNYKFDRNKLVLRRDAKNVEVHINSGFGFSFRVEFRKYDYEYEVIDEYVGEKVVHFDVNDNVTGKVCKAEITLTNHEHATIKKLESQTEQDKYFNELIKKKGFRVNLHND